MRRLAPLLLLVAGCGDALPVASFIDKLRILAVKAEPPEMAPGETTTLSTLTVGPLVSTLALDAGPVVEPRFLWLACPQPEGVTVATPCGVSETTAPPDCAVEPNAPFCAIGEGPEARYSTGATGTRLITVVAADTDGGPIQCLLDIQANGGRPPYPDRCVVALKRLVVSSADTAARNHNPELASLSLGEKDAATQMLTTGDAQFPVAAADDKRAELLLGVVRAQEAAEKNPSGAYEALSVAFFTTSGKIDGNRGVFDPPGCASQEECSSKEPILDVATTWRPPTADELTKNSDVAGSVRFWAVLRDDRGGVGWLAGVATPR